MIWTPSSLKSEAWPTKCASAGLADLCGSSFVRIFFLNLRKKNNIILWTHPFDPPPHGVLLLTYHSARSSSKARAHSWLSTAAASSPASSAASLNQRSFGHVTCT